MRATDRRGPKVLLAVDGFFEPGNGCVPGELLIPAPPCRRPRCTCEDDFHGAGSHGTASVGRVRRLRGVPRPAVLAAVEAAMAQHAEFEDPARDAAAFLDEIATIEEDRLVRREEHVLLPFPAAARIAGAGSIAWDLDDEP